MTDGATSHQRFIDQSDLRRLRRAEALEATAVLGIESDKVHFLDFPDSRLAAFHKPAVDKTVALLASVRPEEVYVPYRRDGTPDHEATFRIVAEAAAHMDQPLRFLEYPVWFWNRWPWVPLPIKPSRSTLEDFAGAAKARFGLEMLREFRSGVLVESVLDKKRSALARHLTQMTRLREGTQWPILSDVSDGSFLQCFFRKFEVFRCSDLP
jgi:LmbE family N-acetylglucosaminyl deacetylase